MMPRTITGQNVTVCLESALYYMRHSGVRANSRNGPVLRAPVPVISTYFNPRQRLVFDPTRDANNVFHLMEAIWMLAGEDNVQWLLPFNSKFSQYAEADGRQWGAYGRRWRKHFDRDQLFDAIKELRKPDNRRVVVGMWAPYDDLGTEVRDVPCNTHIYFQVRDRQLQMTVCCRSNDMIWGAYGANAVHFSILQELMAWELGVGVGPYYQFSNDFHMYLEMGPGAAMLQSPILEDPYSLGYPTFPLLSGTETFADFLADCEDLIYEPGAVFRTMFFRAVAKPLMDAYLDRKRTGGWDISMIPECDWKLSFECWAARRNGNGRSE